MGMSPVIDRVAFGQLCGEAHRLLGSETKAAVALGIRQPHFHRLRRGRVGKRVHNQLRGRLWKIVRPRDRDGRPAASGARFARMLLLFERAFYGEGRVHQHEAMQRARRYEHPARQYHERGPVGEATQLVKAMLMQSPYRGFLEDYRKAAVAARRTPPQIAIGIGRALEPLVAGELSGGVSGPRIRDLLQARILKSYLRAAFKAESIVAWSHPREERPE